MPNSASFAPATPTIAAPIAETRRPRVKFPAGDLADRLAGWVPDETLRNKFLAANPARRHDFRS